MELVISGFFMAAQLAVGFALLAILWILICASVAYPSNAIGLIILGWWLFRFIQLDIVNPPDGEWYKSLAWFLLSVAFLAYNPSPKRKIKHD